MRSSITPHRPGKSAVSVLRVASLAVLAIVLLAYPVDWLLWTARTHSGQGMSSVLVTRTVAASLKGEHFEVYSQDEVEVPCSRSLLPEAGSGPCWWLRRHPRQVIQY